ncbi:hypothetical protein QTP70_012539 [Hemibagrus guttatus]|uniref:Uncharacterized protein n=1 Tax=Hemibagrus guttatus TaxID=175788 RepID=A0AAE0QCR8_9TELE|nr:hypothetical protein QTP70_012539 [Hemibagrus guttatus]
MERFLGFVKQIRRSRRRKGKKYRPEEDYHEGYEDVYYYASEHLHTSFDAEEADFADFRKTVELPGCGVTRLLEDPHIALTSSSAAFFHSATCTDGPWGGLKLLPFCPQTLRVPSWLVFCSLQHKHCPCGKYSSIRVATYLRSKILFPKLPDEQEEVRCRDGELLTRFAMDLIRHRLGHMVELRVRSRFFD